MASEPLSGPDPDVDALRVERDALEARALEAEQVAEQLAIELAAAREQLAREDHAHLTLFSETRPTGDAKLAADGSDPGVLPVALTGLAVVAFLVTLLSAANSGVTALFTVVMLALTTLLGWLAWRTRVVTVDVTVSPGGVVAVESAGTTHRFDLRSESTRLEVRGSPEDSDWQVRFLRRALDPFTITARDVDPSAFMAQLRRHRPEL